ncbi:uncharacterized protein LOC134269740 [Saccostrea cucullata]|uniref:uncharacterized protein LOC134269740 n=1 Tax=Saccostrea cuccullata TaxID=36930 RepID=UPI002ED2097C
MGCLFCKQKTDIWNDDVQGFDNFALDEREVSGRTSQTFDVIKAARRRRCSSERSGIWMNLDKHIYLGRDNKGTQTTVNTTSEMVQTIVNTTSEMVQTDQVWRMYDDKVTQTGDDTNDDSVTIKHESNNANESATCEKVNGVDFKNVDSSESVAENNLTEDNHKRSIVSNNGDTEESQLTVDTSIQGSIASDNDGAKEGKLQEENKASGVSTTDRQDNTTQSTRVEESQGCGVLSDTDCSSESVLVEQNNKEVCLPTKDKKDVIARKSDVS